MDRHSRNWPHICAECGEPFLGIKQAKYCSRKCACHAAGAAFAKAAAVKAASKRVPSDRALRRARLAARDAAYAAAFPKCASGLVRGRVVAGGHSGMVSSGIHCAIVRRTVANVNEV